MRIFNFCVFRVFRLNCMHSSNLYVYTVIAMIIKNDKIIENSNREDSTILIAMHLAMKMVAIRFDKSK